MLTAFLPIRQHPLFLGIVMYPNKVEKKKKKLTVTYRDYSLVSNSAFFHPSQSSLQFGI